MVTPCVVVPPPFDDVNVAVLFSGDTAHVAEVVGLVTCSLIVEPAGSVKVPVLLGDVPQLRTCGFVPWTAHVMPAGMLLPAASRLHVTPGAEGKLSVSVTLYASPGP